MTHTVSTPPSDDFSASSASSDGVPAPAVTRLADISAEVAGVLTTMEELSDYLHRVVQSVRRHVEGCDEVGITLLVGDRPHTAAYSTVQTLEIDAAQYALDEGPCLEAARTRAEQGVADLRIEDGRWPRFTAMVREDGMRSLLALPLVSGEECVGALNLYAWAPEAFDDVDRALVRATAGRCADAVVAVTQLDGMRRLAGQLEQAMASRAVIEQAKGVIMALRGIPEHDAFEVLRDMSQARNVKVRVLAEQVISGVGAGSHPVLPDSASAS